MNCFTHMLVLVKKDEPVSGRSLFIHPEGVVPNVRFTFSMRMDDLLSTRIFMIPDSVLEVCRTCRLSADSCVMSDLLNRYLLPKSVGIDGLSPERQCVCRFIRLHSAMLDLSRPVQAATSPYGRDAAPGRTVSYSVVHERDPHDSSIVHVRCVLTRVPGMRASLDIMQFTNLPEIGPALHVREASGRGMATDDVMNDCIRGMVADACGDETFADRGLFVFNTFLMGRLTQDGLAMDDRAVNTAVAQTANGYGTRREGGARFSVLVDKRYLIVALNKHKIHWKLCIFRMFTKASDRVPFALILDPQNDTTDDAFDCGMTTALFRFVQAHVAVHAPHRVGEMDIGAGYQSVIVPQQRDGVNCGYFVLGYIHALLARQRRGLDAFYAAAVAGDDMSGLLNVPPIAMRDYYLMLPRKEANQ